MKIRLGLLALILILAVVYVCGCKSKEQPVQVDSNQAEPNAVSENRPEEIVVTVNGIDIIKDDFESKVEQQIGEVQRQMPQNFFEQYKKELRKKVMDEMILDIILAQKVQQQGIVITDQEIDERVSEFLQRQKMSMQDFQELLTAKGENFEQFREKVRKNLEV